MNDLINLTTEDDFVLPAYFSQYEGESKGGIVIIQEIFGLTQQLLELADQYAALGFDVIVPALFARITDDIKLEYDQAEKGLDLVSQSDERLILNDIQAAIAALNLEKVTVIGFCWGGGIAYLAASELDLHSGAAFYGTRLPSYLPRKPKCPFQFHFGELDSHSPPEVIQKMKLGAPDCEFYVYPDVGHAFANHHKHSFNEEAAMTGLNRVIGLMLQ
jgi:carboxymethylenebutenolidase